MAFGGNMINFKIPESIKNPNDVCSCFSIDVIKDVGQERSTPIKRDEFRSTNEEGIGVKHEGHAPTLIPPNLVERTPCASIDSAAISLQYIGKPPTPIPIPISTNRLLPHLVQVPNQIQGGRRVHIHLRKQNTTIRKDHYLLPFKDPKHEMFRGKCRGGCTPPCHGVQ
ncbi:hypothetical protein EV1_022546 [Malus domestica]